jgi:cation:H+ antiporter
MLAMLLLADAPAWVTDYPISAVLAGLLLLVIGAEVLVRGAVWIALAAGMSPMAVGLTLVSIGTSLPELLVTLSAADGHADMGMANVLGSNVANVLLIVGAAAAIRAIHVKTRALELSYMLVMTALACVPFFLGARLERWVSIVMLIVLGLFLFQLLARERLARKLIEDKPKHQASALGWIAHLTLLVAGFLGLQYGADWLVDGASQVATDLGMTDAVIGVTVVAIGTSMPELATSAVAALRGQSEICIGNVIGSNIFNVGAVLGGAGIVHPFAFDSSRLFVTLGVTVISAVVLTVILRKANGVPRSVGVAFLLAYAAFTTFVVVAQQAGG